MSAKTRNAVAPTRITVDELRERLNRGEQFTILDNRNPTAWSEASIKLPGSLRVPADEVESRLSEIARDRAIVTYCT